MKAVYLSNYDWRDRDAADAYYWLTVQEIIDDEWRRVRRRAGLFVALFVPILVGLLGASLLLVTQAELTGWPSVMIVAAVGGLLGGVFWCVARLVGLAATRRRLAYDELPPPPDWIVWSGLARGLIGGLAGAVVLVLLLGRESYRPQTVYLVSIASACWIIAKTGAVEVRAE
jgi:hypothetical protein